MVHPNGPLGVCPKFITLVLTIFSIKWRVIAPYPILIYAVRSLFSQITGKLEDFKEPVSYSVIIFTQHVLNE